MSAQEPSQKQIALAFNKTFATPEGRLTLSILRRSFNKPSYVRSDTHDTAYREGQRSVILSINNRLKQAKSEIPDEEEG